MDASFLKMLLDKERSKRQKLEDEVNWACWELSGLFGITTNFKNLEAIISAVRFQVERDREAKREAMQKDREKKA